MTFKEKIKCNRRSGKIVHKVIQGYGECTLWRALKRRRRDNFYSSYLYPGWIVKCCNLESIRFTGIDGFLLPNTQC